MQPTSINITKGEGKPVEENPYLKHFTTFPHEINPCWTQWHTEHPTLPVITPEGKEFTGDAENVLAVRVWQAKNNYPNDTWATSSHDSMKLFNGYGDFESFGDKNNMLTREVWQLCQAKEKEETKITDSDRLYAIIEEYGHGQLSIEKAIKKAFEIGQASKALGD